MEDFDSQLLQFPLRFLKFIGQNPQESKIKFLIVTVLHSACGIIAFSFVFLQLFYIDGNALIVLVQTCEAFVAYGQFMFKSSVVATKMKLFRQLISDTKKFWKTDRFEQNTRKKLDKTFKQVLQVEKVFAFAMVLVTFFIITNVYFTNGIPIGAWIIKDREELHKGVIIITDLFWPYITLIVIGYDCFYLSLCVSVTMQFRMLRKTLKQLNTSTFCTKNDDEAYLNKLIDCIRHHQFLLRYSRNLRDAYSPILFIEYSTVSLATFVELYITLKSEDVFMMLRYVGGIFACTLQLAFYCFPVNYITDEATSVAQAIYESGWNIRRTLIIKMTPFVIQRSQKEIIFTAGGLIDINCKTVLTVLKVAYSICTVMRALDNR